LFYQDIGLNTVERLLSLACAVVSFTLFTLVGKKRIVLNRSILLFFGESIVVRKGQYE
jgi:hypothetical protein